MHFHSLLCATNMESAAALAVAAGGAAWAAAAAAFLAMRLILWALGVTTAYYELVTESEKSWRRRRHSTQAASARLTKALRRHNVPAPRRRSSPTDSDASSSDEWSSGDEARREEREVPEAEAPAHPVAVVVEARPAAANAAAAAAAGAAAAGERAAALGAAGLVGVQPAAPAPSKYEPHRHGMAVEMHKKPWVKRKVEKYIYAPATGQGQGLARVVHRGFAKLGRRVEIAALGMGEDLAGAIRAAGVEAVAAVEEVALRFIKFSGSAAVLTVVLLPLPAVRFSVALG
jgi:hypothetical protein